MSCLLLLGGNVLNSGFADVAARFGAQLKVVDWSGPDAVSWAPPSSVIKADIKADGLLGIIKEEALAFCYSSADVAVENVVRFNQRAGLLGPSIDAIHHCAHKDRAYDCFHKAGVLGREYVCVTQEEALDTKNLIKQSSEYLAKIPDIVVKPTNSSSSRGVHFLRNPKPEALARLVADISAEFQSSVLIDKYIPGDEYSIEMVVDADGHVMVWPVGFNGKSMHHTSEAISVKVIYNPVLDEALKEKMIAFAVACAKSTGLRSSLAHLEVKLAPWGELYPMEIAARSSGFVATHLCDMASRHSYLGTYYDVLRGRTLTHEYAGESGDSSVYFFYDPPSGKMMTDLAADALPFDPNLFTVTHGNPLKMRTGEDILVHKNDVTKKNFLILKTKARAGLHEEMLRAERAFYAQYIAP